MESIINYSIGILGIVIGTLVSYYFYRRSIRIKEPVFSIRTNNLISGYSSQFQSLKVLYKDEEIENFSTSKILFYNRGAETINQEDINTVNHLRIVPIEGVKILDASVLQSNNPSNQFILNLDYEKNEVFINFDYIDQNQGVVIQVLHDSGRAEFSEFFSTLFGGLRLVGDIKGVNNINAISNPTKRSVRWLTRYANSKVVKILLVIVTIFFVLYLFVASYYSIFYPDIYEQYRLFLNTILNSPSVLIFLSLVMLAFAYILTDATFTVMKDNKFAPNGLESFDE